VDLHRGLVHRMQATVPNVSDVGQVHHLLQRYILLFLWKFIKRFSGGVPSYHQLEFLMENFYGCCNIKFFFLFPTVGFLHKIYG
jgi:hypothetical protein